MLKLVLGEFGSVLLEGQRAVTGVLARTGFEFKFPTVDKALTDLLKR
jgi:NAD dependent epimerase/dehydratase family enzyme